jgi:hypothetical protein
MSITAENYAKIAQIEDSIERDVQYCARKSAIEQELINADEVTSQIGFAKLQMLAVIDILEKRILPLRHRRLQDKIYVLQAQTKS